MDDTDPPSDDRPLPRLWNPNAAACWSLLFTPAFGAALHAANCRTLDKPDRAAANRAWVWATIVFLLVNLGTLFIPDSRAVDLVMRLAGLGLLLGWYFGQGGAHVRYISAKYGDDYTRRGWGRPIGIALGAIAGYLLTAGVIAFFFYKPDPAEVANEVRPLILAEWQKQPGLAGASIQGIDLSHAGGNSYRGIVSATLGGRPERLPLMVTHDGWTITWQVQPVGP